MAAAGTTSTGRIGRSPASTKKKPSAPAGPETDGSVADLERLSHLAACRIAIEGVVPEIDGGRFPAKSVVDAPFIVEADIFGDGHDTIDAALLYRPAGGAEWAECPMEFIVNDRWRCSITFGDNRMFEYTFIAWRDLFGTWRKDTAKKFAAGLDIGLEIEEGRRLLEEALEHCREEADAVALEDLITACKSSASDQDRLAMLSTGETVALMRRAAPRTNLTQYERILNVFVDRRAAAFSAWYEMFPRSQSGDVSRHGTFDDVIARLPYVRDLGFDVLYFPPIHPIGTTNRKGRNNTLTPDPDDPGSPYAIGSEEGGHDA